jgi:hypothetical protein
MALFNSDEMGRVVVNAVATFVSLSSASLSASASTPTSSTTTTSIPIGQLVQAGRNKNGAACENSNFIFVYIC